MKKNNNREKIFTTILWITGMLILVLFVIIWYRVVAFDTDDEIVTGSDTDSNVVFEVPGEDEATDVWQTTIQKSASAYDHAVHTGKTVGCNLTNTNSYKIKNWILRLDISDECYLNGFWCGSIEIHQFRDGQEITCLLQNQLVDYKALNVDYNEYSDNMLIHLMPGDYLIYYPSEEAKENVVDSDATVGIGFIFYYQNHLDLTNWSITYGNDLKMTDLLMFKIAIGILILWVSALIWFFILINMKNKMKRELEAQIKNFSIMAELYLEAYIIDIENDSAQLIKDSNSKSALNLSENNVQETLNNKIMTDGAELFRTPLLEFVNLGTVIERMNNESSISIEFFDKNIGWSELRFFKVSDEKNNHQVVLTVQDVNEQKRKLDIIEERMNLAEYKQAVSGSFIETVSFALKDISSKIGVFGNSIIANSDQEEIKNTAHCIVNNTRHLYLIQNMVLDLFEIENKKLRLCIEEYNIYDVVNELKSILEPLAIGKNCELKLDIDEGIPTRLLGDYGRIEQILVIIMFSSILMSEGGHVKLSVFGKRHDDFEELMISVRDTTMGFTEKQRNEIHEFINGGRIDNNANASLIYFRIINGILNYMDSELKFVSVVDEGSDFYFSLKQKIVE